MRRCSLQIVCDQFSQPDQAEMKLTFSKNKKTIIILWKKYNEGRLYVTNTYHTLDIIESVVEQNMNGDNVHYCLNYGELIDSRSPVDFLAEIFTGDMAI